MAKRHFKQSFDISSGAQSKDFDTLRTALLTGATPFAAGDGQLGVPLEGQGGVVVAASVDVNETLLAGELVPYVLAPVDLNADGSVPTMRWSLLSGVKTLLINERDVLVLFNELELPGIGRLLVLPQGVQTSAGATALVLTYSARKKVS